MSEYTDQRDAIVAILQAVPGIGRVHNRPRYGDARQHWTTEAGDIETVNAWELGLDDPGTEVIRYEQHWRHRYRHWIIRGYMSIRDEADTYSQINALAEAIGDALDADQHLLLDGNETCVDHEPCQITETAVVVIGGDHYCWGVSLTMRTLTVV